MNHANPTNWLVGASSFSADGSRLATATQGSIIVWDVRDGRAALKQPMAFYDVYNACSTFSQDGRFLAYHSNGQILVWDMTTHQRVASIAALSDRCFCLALSPDGRLLAAGYEYDGSIQMWTLPDARLRASLDAGQKSVRGLSFSPDGLLLASGGEDRTIVVWDCDVLKPVRTLRGHSDEVWRVAFSPDGQWLVSAGKDKTVKLWKTRLPVPRVPFVPYPTDMYAHVWRPAYLCRYGDHFMMARSNGTFRVFSKSALRMLGEYPLPVTNAWRTEIAPDGRQLACWCADGNVRVFEIGSFKQSAQFQMEGHQGALAFSPDGKVLAASVDGTMWAWDLKSQTELIRDETNEGAVIAIAFSLDGRWMSSSRFLSRAVVWDLVEKRRVAVLPTSEGVIVRDAAIDPSRRYVITVADEDEVRLWDASRQKQIAGPREISTRHLSAAFSPDGGRFATGGGAYVTIWDLTTQRQVGVLKSPHGTVVWLEFTDDDRSLLVAADKGVFSWRAPSFEEIARTQREGRR